VPRSSGRRSIRCIAVPGKVRIPVSSVLIVILVGIASCAAPSNDNALQARIDTAPPIAESTDVRAFLEGEGFAILTMHAIAQELSGTELLDPARCAERASELNSSVPPVQILESIARVPDSVLRSYFQDERVLLADAVARCVSGSATDDSSEGEQLTLVVRSIDNRLSEIGIQS